MTNTNRPKFITAEKYAEKDLNFWRAKLLPLDQLKNRKTITILKETDDALSDLASRIREVQTPTYDYLILAAVKAYKESHNLKENMGLNEIMTDDTIEDDN
jgi:hypothetical protein